MRRVPTCDDVHVKVVSSAAHALWVRSTAIYMFESTTKIDPRLVRRSMSMQKVIKGGRFE